MLYCIDGVFMLLLHVANSTIECSSLQPVGALYANTYPSSSPPSSSLNVLKRVCVFPFIFFFPFVQTSFTNNAKHLFTTPSASKTIPERSPASSTRSSASPVHRGLGSVPEGIDLAEMVCHFPSLPPCHVLNITANTCALLVARCFLFFLSPLPTAIPFLSRR